MNNQQEDEPDSNIFNVLLRWLHPGCIGLPVHQMHLFGRGFTGGSFERSHFDLERICFRQNFNRERFGDNNGVF